MQPYLWRAIDRLIGIYELFGSLVVTMDVNKKKLKNRAENSFANVTELADTLVRSEGFHSVKHIVLLVNVLKFYLLMERNHWLALHGVLQTHNRN